MAWNVFSVVARPSSPASNFMVGTQRPKSRPAMLEATKPSKLPVTAFVTAAVPEAPLLDVDAAVAAAAAAAAVVLAVSETAAA